MTIEIRKMEEADRDAAMALLARHLLEGDQALWQLAEPVLHAIQVPPLRQCFVNPLGGQPLEPIGVAELVLPLPD